MVLLCREKGKNASLDDWINGKKRVNTYSQRHPESPGVTGEGEGGLFRISFYGKDPEEWING